MANKKKPNPRKIPRTEADCKRAHDEGMLNGVEFCVNLCLWTLADKWHMNHDQIKDFLAGYEKYSELIRDGVVKYPEVVDCLKREYEIVVDFKPGFRDRQDQPLNGMNEGRENIG